MTDPTKQKAILAKLREHAALPDALTFTITAGDAATILRMLPRCIHGGTLPCLQCVANVRTNLPYTKGDGLRAHLAGYVSDEATAAIAFEREGIKP